MLKIEVARKGVDVPRTAPYLQKQNCPKLEKKIQMWLKILLKSSELCCLNLESNKS